MEGDGSGDGSGSRKILCEYCNTKFAFKSSLNKHLKRKHKVMSRKLVSSSSSSDAQSFNCHDCSKKYHHRTSLYRHVKEKHPSKSLNSKNIQIKHDTPSKGSSQKANLVSCSICQFSCHSFDTLVKHYVDHEIDIKTETYNFDSFSSFLAWKEDEEKQCNNRYVKNYGTKTRANGCKAISYYCHRNGFYKSSNNGKRHLKVQGSRKIGKLCPSRMFIKIQKNGKVSLKYVVSHLGHNADICHMNLSATERKTLASKIALKIPFENILDEIRNTAYNDTTIRRLHLITRQDLRNIVKCSKLTAEPIIEAESANLEINSNENSRESDVNTLHSQLTLATSNSLPNENFQQAKKKYLFDLTQYIEKNITTPEELSLVEKIFKQIVTTIEALKQQNILLPKQSNEPAG